MDSRDAGRRNVPANEAQMKAKREWFYNYKALQTRCPRRGCAAADKVRSDVAHDLIC